MIHVERPLFIGQLAPKYASRTEIVANNFDKRKTQMGAKQRRLFESVAGDLLEELDYETEGKVGPISSLEKFRWKAHHHLFWSFAKLNARQKSPYTASLIAWAKLRSLWKRRAVLEVAGGQEVSDRREPPEGLEE